MKPAEILKALMSAMVPEPDKLLVEIAGAGDHVTVCATTIVANQSRLIGKRGVRITALKTLARHLPGDKEITIFLRDPSEMVRMTGLKSPESVPALFRELFATLWGPDGWKLSAHEVGGIVTMTAHVPTAAADEVIEAIQALVPAIEKAMNRAINLDLQPMEAAAAA